MGDGGEAPVHSQAAVLLLHGLRLPEMPDAWRCAMTENKRESVRIVQSIDTGQSWNELDIASLQDYVDAVDHDGIYPPTPGSPEAYLYACGEELAEERRAHRVTKGLLVEAQGRPTYFGLGFVTGLAFAFFMSAVVTLL